MSSSTWFSSLAKGDLCLTLACLSVACGSGSAPEAPSAGKDAGDAPASAADAASSSAAPAAGGAGAVTETGVLIDYESMSPIPGLTVTDNGVSATTDAKGAFSLIAPSTATVFAPTVTGPSYSTLMFPQTLPVGGAIDFGTNVIPDSQTYTLEQDILQNDQTEALVQVVVQVGGACTSAAGGTLQVVSPSGAHVMYLSLDNIPNSGVTSFQAVTSPRAVAVVYDIPVGETLTLSVTHPTCTLASFPVAGTSDAGMLTGLVTTKATEPGDVNAAVVLMLH